MKPDNPNVALQQQRLKYIAAVVIGYKVLVFRFTVPWFRTKFESSYPAGGRLLKLSSVFDRELEMENSVFGINLQWTSFV